jgi:2-oxoglutarate dehydrogenase complex dehydrogenase (E1) component-like enzyme
MIFDSLLSYFDAYALLSNLPVHDLKYLNFIGKFVRFRFQEEHKNQGAWSYVQPRFQTAVGGYDRRIHYVGREVS